MTRTVARLLRRLADRLDPTARNRHVPVHPEYAVVNIDGAQIVRAIRQYKRRNGGGSLGL